MNRGTHPDAPLRAVAASQPTTGKNGGQLLLMLLECGHRLTHRRRSPPVGRVVCNECRVEGRQQ